MISPARRRNHSATSQSLTASSTAAAANGRHSVGKSRSSSTPCGLLATVVAVAFFVLHQQKQHHQAAQQQSDEIWQKKTTQVITSDYGDGSVSSSPWQSMIHSTISRDVIQAGGNTSAPDVDDTAQREVPPSPVDGDDSAESGGNRVIPAPASVNRNATNSVNRTVSQASGKRGRRHHATRNGTSGGRGRPRRNVTVVYLVEDGKEFGMVPQHLTTDDGVTMTLTLEVRLSGNELTDYLSALARALWIQWRTKSYDFTLEMKAKPSPGFDAEGWKRTSQILAFCFPAVGKKVQFDTAQEGTQNLAVIANPSTDKDFTELVALANEARTTGAKPLVVSDQKPSVSIASMTRNQAFFEELRQFLQLDEQNPNCCQVLPHPDEVVYYHDPMALPPVEIRKLLFSSANDKSRNAKGGSTQLGPVTIKNLAATNVTHKLPIAIVSRLLDAPNSAAELPTTPSADHRLRHVYPYVESLRQRHSKQIVVAQTRVIASRGASTAIREFCFLVKIPTELIGSFRSPLLHWAEVLSNTERTRLFTLHPVEVTAKGNVSVTSLLPTSSGDQKPIPGSNRKVFRHFLFQPLNKSSSDEVARTSPAAGQSTAADVTMVVTFFGGLGDFVSTLARARMVQWTAKRFYQLDTQLVADRRATLGTSVRRWSAGVQHLKRCFPTINRGLNAEADDLADTEFPKLLEKQEKWLGQYFKANGKVAPSKFPMNNPKHGGLRLLLDLMDMQRRQSFGTGDADRIAPAPLPRTAKYSIPLITSNSAGAPIPYLQEVRSNPLIYEDLKRYFELDERGCCSEAAEDMPRSAPQDRVFLYDNAQSMQSNTAILEARFPLPPASSAETAAYEGQSLLILGLSKDSLVEEFHQSKVMQYLQHKLGMSVRVVSQLKVHMHIWCALTTREPGRSFPELFGGMKSPFLQWVSMMSPVPLVNLYFVISKSEFEDSALRLKESLLFDKLSCKLKTQGCSEHQSEDRGEGSLPSPREWVHGERTFRFAMIDV